MKISIITPCLNCAETLPVTLSSIKSQNYKNIEHIIVDGGSTDSTIEILNKYKFKNKKIFYFKNKNLYDSINYGIKKSSGDLIGILNADDFYSNEKTIKILVNKVKKSNAEIFIGNTVYFDNKNFDRIVRYYCVKNFKKSHLNFGLMPSHTASFVKKQTYKDVGLYNKKMKIAADFDFFLKSILIFNKKYEYLNQNVTRMRTGGISGKELKSYIISTFEIIKSFKNNSLYPSFLFFRVLARLPVKLIQFYNFNEKKLNKELRIKKYPNYKKYFYDFKIIKNISNLNFKENFILSALNLAFLGSYFKKEINYNPNLINWPDGVFSKYLYAAAKKIPGRDLLNSIKLPNIINRIIVLGNLSLNGKKFIANKFSKKIKHIELVYGNADNIFNNLNHKKFSSRDLILITLPTPKQEILADKIAAKNFNYKIICIGGSISIACGDERAVPKILYSFEWLWRLRYETKRRTVRLLKTFYYYSVAKIFNPRTKHFGIYIIE